jgi:hypothetical protein
MPRGPPTKGWKVALITAIVLAVLFVVFGGISHGFSARSVVILGLAGATIGAMLAPDLEPSAFRLPALWQVSCGVAGCLLVALYLRADSTGYGLAVVGGAFLGFTAPWWIKFIQFP